MKTKVLLSNVSLSSVPWQPRQWVDQNLTHAQISVLVQTLTQKFPDIRDVLLSCISSTSVQIIRSEEDTACYSVMNLISVICNFTFKQLSLILNSLIVQLHSL